jgi:hypothetical protein
MRIQPAKSSPPGADPESTVGVFKKTNDIVAGDAFCLPGVVPENRKRLCLSVVPVQSSGESPHPQRPIAAYTDRPDIGIRKRRRVGGIVLKNTKRIAIVSVQSVLSPEPEKSNTILCDRRNGRLGHPLTDGKALEPDLWHLCAGRNQTQSYGKQCENERQAGLYG